MPATPDRPRSSGSDVVIVGAGPTGLALAAQLHAFGVTPRIVDRQPDRVHESRALAIQPRTLEVLRGVGIAGALRERGNAGVRICIHAGGRVVHVPLFDIGTADTAFPFLLFLSQSVTESVLAEHLAARGVRVERSVELAGFQADGNGVAFTLRHAGGRTEHGRTRYLAGCDGAHSTVRNGAGIPFEGASYPQTFVLADLEVDQGLERGSVHAFLGPDGILFFFPLGHPATWRMQAMRSRSPRSADAGRPDAPPSLAELQAIADPFTRGTLRLSAPVWSTCFRLHHRHAARYRAGPVFLGGDAAHVHSPAGAQGMNTGIQDAVNLGWKLALVARGVAGEDLLDSYEAERRPVGGFVLRFSDRAFSVATSDNPLVRLVRSRVAPRLLPLVLGSARGRAMAFRTVSQLGIRYRDSPAVESAAARHGGARAGDRLPDAALARDGQPTSLHEETAPPGFHLLLCGPPDGWDGVRVAALQAGYGSLLRVHRLDRAHSPGALVDVRGEAFARLGVGTAACFLVRPDGHVAVRTAGTDLTAAAGYLARWLPGCTEVGGRRGE